MLSVLEREINKFIFLAFLPSFFTRKYLPISIIDFKKSKWVIEM